MKRLYIFKSILWSITGLAIAAGITRMIFGLGSITNLSDSTPWGFWKGFNVIPGIALAAGGFVVTAIIYVMGKREYHRYAKVTVLLALLGYISAATALVVELGLPWMVWKPVIYWQPHSALFEVAWCVILYLTVLFLEFIPVPLEETSKLAKVRKFLTKYKIVLVFLGIMISTLHQSSLGTMFLIVPGKLHALWYSSFLPLLFFISAVAVGPLMLILAVLTISYFYYKPLERQKLSTLAFWSVFAISIYGIIRLVDLVVHDKLTFVFNGSWQSVVFLIEFALIVVIPILLLGIKRFRNSKTKLWLGCISAVVGILINRANVAGIMLVFTGQVYIPTIFEIFISLGIVSAVILVFLFCIEHFNVWDVKWENPKDKPDSYPEFDRPSEVWLGTPKIASRAVFSLIFVLSLAFGFSLISTDRIQSKGIDSVIVQKARGGDTLFVDGNMDGYGVSFPHEFHVEKNGDKQSCVLCHHMNLPKDKQSGCYSCHQRMYTTADAFKHDWHASPSGGNITCNECHPTGQERLTATAQKCDVCHKDLYPVQAAFSVEQYNALSYTDAMHSLCVDCHRNKELEFVEKKDLDRCANCHESTPPSYLKPEYQQKFKKKKFNHVVLPLISLKKQTEEVTDNE